MKSTVTETASKIVLGLIAVLFTLGIFGSSAEADEFDRIERLAKQIQQKARLLTKETVHYRHTAQYRALVRESAALCNAATHIVKIVHYDNNLHQLESDLAIIDQCFHDLVYLFDATEEDVHHGYGQIHGQTAQVKRLLNSIESCIYQTRRDVDRLQRRIKRNSRYVPAKPVVVPKYKSSRPASGYYYSTSRRGGASISIGGGKSKFTFKF